MIKDSTFPLKEGVVIVYGESSTATAAATASFLLLLRSVLFSISIVRISTKINSRISDIAVTVAVTVTDRVPVLVAVPVADLLGWRVRGVVVVGVRRSIRHRAAPPTERGPEIQHDRPTTTQTQHPEQALTVVVVPHHARPRPNRSRSNSPPNHNSNEPYKVRVLFL